MNSLGRYAGIDANQWTSPLRFGFGIALLITAPLLVALNAFWALPI